MTDVDPLSELFTLFAAPVAGTIRSVEQFRKGVDEFLSGVENFNRTMENLNQTAERMNGLLEEVEEPLRAAIPQVTRTVKTADQMMQVVSGPAMAIAPGLDVLARALATPEFEQFPRQLAQFTEVLSELSSRLAPLTQLAGSAGGLLGGMRIPGFSAPGVPEGRAAPAGSRRPADRAGARPDAEKQASKKAAVKKPAAKKTASAKKAAVKKTAVKKSATAKKKPPAED